MRAVLWGIASGLVLASACQPSPKAEAERHPLVTAALIVKEPGPTPSGMTWVPGGQMFIGNKEGQMDEQPVRLVYLDGFWMDTTEVTTRQFAEFVSATKYVTVAERGIPADKSPTGAAVPPGSLVWVKFEGTNQWKYVEGANWRRPRGGTTTEITPGDDPVVHVAYEDALAYCRWAGKSLPTEVEWELAARRGSVGTRALGDPLPDAKGPHANIWNGDFPAQDLLEDGFGGVAPVKSFPVAANGLYDIEGNVWEWCEDWYRADAYVSLRRLRPAPPTEPWDPSEPEVGKRVVRGGSFLCARGYCEGYRPTARMKTSPDTGSAHIGFRCIKRPLPSAKTGSASAQS